MLAGARIFYNGACPPLAAAAVAFMTKTTVKMVQDLPDAQPLLFTNNGMISRDLAIARVVAQAANSDLYPAGDAWTRAAIDEWLEFAQVTLPSPEAVSVLNNVLSTRTYVVGYSLTLADVGLLFALVRHKLDESNLPNIARYVALVKALVPWKRCLNQLRLKPVAPAGAGKGAGKGKAGKAGGKGAGKGKGKGGGKGGGAGGGAGASGDALAGNCPPLKGAVRGKVVTRFPPEPSGYLHIGHVKAVLLNEYYARYYKGKLLVRFDDTNPSKEKQEFQESILEDLAMLGVKPDMTSHTSDHFELIYKYARKLLNDGFAYMDDTPVEKMREERFDGIESVNRSASVAENLRRFDDMCKGTEEGRRWCMRAKMDMKHDNKCMRDPTLYRSNLTPHARTGTKYKAYPLYDLACPIVDSVEGVTHALRTTEYNDRNLQYQWLQEKMGLRPVLVHEFSRLSFINTVLSKRRLTWFVDTNRVTGWDDPRFPTVRGVLRRGLTLEALRSFIYAQGASRSIVDMEWDKFWSSNKKVLEPTAARYTAVAKDSAVLVNVIGGPDKPEGFSQPLHPKVPEMGKKIVMRANQVYVEGDDAATLKVGQEVVLMNWDTVVVSDIQREGNNEDGRVTGMTVKLSPGGDYKKSVKLTWIAATPDVVEVKLHEFDFLISKAKVEKDEDFKDFLNPVTQAVTPAIADAAVRSLKPGTVIQFMRRGFFRVDTPHMDASRPMNLFMVPDGKAGAMSTISSKLSHR